MRSVGGLLGRMLDRENLLRAVHLAAKGRRDQPEVRAYLNRLDEELEALRDNLALAAPQCGECVSFTIHDPKERLITAPVFRERVLHHAVMSVCGPVLDNRLIHHCYACRIGKGTVAALEAARRAAGAAPWFLKLDVRQYFASIPHARLFAALERVFREPMVRRLLARLVTAYQPNRASGLAIGTLVSQHLANFYLAPLDTMVVQELRPAGYIRYMDDLALWTPDAAGARHARDRLREFAATALGLEFKTTGTTTSVSVPAPAPADSRSALMEPARHPVPPPDAADETATTRRWPVAPGRPSAPSQGERRVPFQ